MGILFKYFVISSTAIELFRCNRILHICREEKKEKKSWEWFQLAQIDPFSLSFFFLRSCGYLSPRAS